jgi:hypothetical protein
MKNILRTGSIVVAVMLLGTLGFAAPKSQHISKSFTVAGKVLEINEKDRTWLVTDRQTEQLYLIKVPEGATFKITFGKNMLMSQPRFDNVTTGERVEIRCKRSDQDHLARLKDGRQVTVLTAAR